MPTIHNPDWNSLKLSDFPQFKCLCELCDCGCFERSKKKHSNQCKKRITKISDAFDSSLIDARPFEKSSLYHETYKPFNYEFDGDNKNKSEFSIKIPIKYKPKEGSIGLPEKEVKFTSVTTNKDHFKSWNSAPARAIAEYPEFAGNLMYPNEKRQYLTTNEELYYKNYGKHKAKSSSLNIFENQFRINQGKNMDLNTVYTKDFHKLNAKPVPHVTKESYERKTLKVIQKIPMDTVTSSMIDYKYDPETFRSSRSQQQNHLQPINDLFKSKLAKGLKPLDEMEIAYDTQYNLSYRDKTYESNVENSKQTSPVHSINHSISSDQHNLTHNRNIRFLTSFDNRLIPSLKVINKIPPIRSSSQSLNTSLVEGADFENENDLNNTTYKQDYKDRGNSICMAKVYGVVANKSALNQSIG